jgi:acyl-CoA thioesterase I
MSRLMRALTLVLWIAVLSAIGRAAQPAAPAAAAASAEKTRVACLGDSITFGAGVEDRDTNCYPVQLGRMLGDKYDVRNFGVSGATLLNQGDKPYRKEKAYQAARDFKPHVVIIKLGTNDTKPQNWKYQDDFIADYKQMILELSASNMPPRIWLCTPVPAYPGNWGIDDGRIRAGVIPKIEQVSKDTGLPVIDLYRALSARPKLFPDKVHPNAEGAKEIAKTVYSTLAPRVTRHH